MIAVTLTAYAPALRGGFLWDDDRYVSRNPHLQSADGLRQIWLCPGATDQYYPLVFTSFWMERRAWCDSTLGYHVVNVLLHAANALLLWRILHRLAVPGGKWAALIFALHPVHVESVAWITERKNVLSGCCYLAAGLFYMRFAGLGRTPEQTNRPGRPIRNPGAFYALSITCFCLALLSKTITATLPAALLLIVWWKRGRVGRRDVLPLLPFFAIGAASGLLTAWLEQRHVGAIGPEWELSIRDRGLIAGRAVWFYLGKLLWPGGLSFIYPRWPIGGSSWPQVLLPISAVLLPIVLWINRAMLGRGPLVAALFFGGTLLPALGFLNVYPMRFSFVADHFQYLASIGPIVLCSAILSRGRRPTVPLVSAGVVILLALLTFQQARHYQSPAALWEDTLRKNPDAWLAHNNLGILLDRPQDRELAISHFQAAIRLNPTFFEAHYNLGNRLRDGGRTDDALSHYHQATRLRPDYVDAQYNLGCLLESLGRMDEAAVSFEAAVRHAPGDDAAHFKLAEVEAGRGRWTIAIEQYRAALGIRPEIAQTHRGLADALVHVGQSNEAIVHYRRAIQLRPQDSEAIRGLAVALRASATPTSQPADTSRP